MITGFQDNSGKFPELSWYPPSMIFVYLPVLLPWVPEVCTGTVRLLTVLGTTITF